MTLSIPGYFDYPHRRPGLDHDRYDHRYLVDAPAVAWPNGAPIALWITVPVHHFPLDMTARPFVPAGGMTRVAPDVWNYTLRDYGNRVGIFRIMRMLADRNLTATAAMSARIAERYPVLLDAIVGRGWEVMASGMDMGRLHHGGLPIEEEKALVDDSFAILRRASGQPVTGWHSPEFSESSNTPDLVAAAGGDHVADYLNDDMPYAMRTKAGALTAMPLSEELSDKKILYVQNQPLAAWEQQVLAAHDVLRAEGEGGAPRILSLTLTPWVIGQPYRIQALARVLDAILAAGPIWNVNARAISECARTPA